MLILCLTIYIVYRIEKKKNPNASINWAVSDDVVKCSANMYFMNEVIKR